MVVLTRYVRAHCPAQKIDEYTAEAWLETFNALPFPVSLNDAKAAVIQLGTEHDFIAPKDIVEVLREVHAERMRQARLQREQQQRNDPEWQERERRSIQHEMDMKTAWDKAWRAKQYGRPDGDG